MNTQQQKQGHNAQILYKYLDASGRYSPIKSEQRKAEIRIIRERKDLKSKISSLNIYLFIERLFCDIHNHSLERHHKTELKTVGF